MATFTVSETLRVFNGTKPENGSCRWMMSKASLFRSCFILGLSHTDTETRAMDPLLGMGTGLPIGTKLSGTRSVSEQGPKTTTSFPAASSWLARFRMWSVTPP